MNKTLVGDTASLNRIRLLEQEYNVKFPITEHQALKMRGVGRVTFNVMMACGLIKPDPERVKAQIAEVEKRIKWFEGRLESERQKLERLQAGLSTATGV